MKKKIQTTEKRGPSLSPININSDCWAYLYPKSIEFVRKPSSETTITRVTLKKLGLKYI